jgi:hypothetical protein
MPPGYQNAGISDELVPTFGNDTEDGGVAMCILDDLVTALICIAVFHMVFLVGKIGSILKATRFCIGTVPPEPGERIEFFGKYEPQGGGFSTAVIRFSSSGLIFQWFSKNGCEEFT